MYMNEAVKVMQSFYHPAVSSRTLAADFTGAAVPQRAQVSQEHMCQDQVGFIVWAGFSRCPSHIVPFYRRSGKCLVSKLPRNCWKSGEPVWGHSSGRSSYHRASMQLQQLTRLLSSSLEWLLVVESLRSSKR